MLMFPSGTKVWLEERPVTLRAVLDESTSPTLKEIGPAEPFSLIDWSEMSEIVGGSLTAFTVKVKRVVSDRLPSLTKTPMTLFPD
jgi:hypothetical protein